MAPRKPPERRQRRNTADTGVVVALKGQVIGAKPAVHWHPEVMESWSDLWSSPLAAMVKFTDLPALKRLHEYRHQLVLALEAYGDEPTVAGSMGQPVLSPFAAEIHRLEGVIGKLEDKFGLTPLARLRLGVTFEEGTSLAARNAALLQAFQAGQK